MSQDYLSIFNPLPVFGVNSNVPMEVPFIQIISGAMQKIGINEIFTLRPVAGNVSDSFDFDIQVGEKII